MSIIKSTGRSPSKLMRIFATSDLHTDFLANWTWLESLSAYDYPDDALIICGGYCAYD
jgi:hypothetical protein